MEHGRETRHDACAPPRVDSRRAAWTRHGSRRTTEAARHEGQRSNGERGAAARTREQSRGGGTLRNDSCRPRGFAAVPLWVLVRPSRGGGVDDGGVVRRGSSSFSPGWWAALAAWRVRRVLRWGGRLRGGTLLASSGRGVLSRGAAMSSRMEFSNGVGRAVCFVACGLWSGLLSVLAWLRRLLE